MQPWILYTAQHRTSHLPMIDRCEKLFSLSISLFKYLTRARTLIEYDIH